ncbi:MAG TPA: hypothetical protein VFA65_20920 [Bryobacteraceae bacterium]|nr:hypothetical protein [Bryobacteraceae bacterium]
MPELVLGQRRGPLQITLSLTRNVETFGQIANTGITLSGINATYFDLPVFSAESYFGGRNVTKIKSFRLESPPVATVFADPAWLAVFLALASLGFGALQAVAAYPQIKKGARELYHDVNQVRAAAHDYVDETIATVHGLAEDELNQLRIAVYLWIDAITKAPVDVATRILRRALKLRRLIMRRAGRALHIQVE